MTSWQGQDRGGVANSSQFSCHLLSVNSRDTRTTGAPATSARRVGPRRPQPIAATLLHGRPIARRVLQARAGGLTAPAAEAPPHCGL